MEDREWRTVGTYPNFGDADRLRHKLVFDHPELKQGLSIQIKLKSDGYRVRIAKNRVSEDLRRALNLK